LDIEDREDFVQRDVGLLNRLIDVGQALDGPEQAADVTEKRDQSSERNLVLDDHHAAASNGGDACGGDDQVGGSAQARVDADPADDDVIGLADIAEEAVLLGVLHGKTAHRHDAREHFIEARVDAGPLVEERAFAAVLLGTGEGGDHSGQGQEADHDDRQLPIHSHHDDDGNQQVQDGRKDIEQDLTDRTHEALDAAIKAGHDGANAFRAMEAERHAMKALDGGFEQFVVQAQAGVPGHPIGDRCGGFAKHTQTDQDSDADEQRSDDTMGGEVVKDVFEDERFAGAGGCQQESYEKDTEDRAAIGESKAHRPAQTTGSGGTGNCGIVFMGLQLLGYRP